MLLREGRTSGTRCYLLTETIFPFSIAHCPFSKPACPPQSQLAPSHARTMHGFSIRRWHLAAGPRREGKHRAKTKVLKYCRQPDLTENIPQTSTPPLLVSYLTYILPSSGCFTSCFLHFTEMRGHPTSQSQCLSLISRCLCCRQHERRLHDRQLRRYVQWI